MFLGCNFIAKAKPQNSELRTNSLTFEDIQNSSSSRAMSGGVSGGIAERKGESQSQEEITNAKQKGNGNSFNPSLPMAYRSQDESVTKATLTEGTIILNKDSQPTQTTAAALGINTELAQANRQTAATADVKAQVAEQQQIAAAVNQVRSAAETFSTNKREEAEQVLQQRQAELAIAKAQGDKAKETQLQDQVDTAQKAVEDWGTGGKNRQAVDATLNGLGLALGGNSVEAVAAGAASPYVNTAIKHATEGSEWANLALHGIWGAVEAATQGANALGGAGSAVTGEVAAKILSEKLYGVTDPEALTEEQKRAVSHLSQMIAGAVSGSTELAQGGDAISSVQNVNVGMGIAKNAVENNLLTTDYSGLAGLARTETEQHRQTRQLLDQIGVESIDDYAEKYRQCESESCKKQVQTDLDKAFNRAYDKLDTLAQSGELTVKDLNKIDEYVTRLRGAYDSKRFKEKGSEAVYFDGGINVLGKNEDRLNQARLYATVSDLAKQGYSEEQINHKLTSEHLAIILSSTAISSGGKQGGGGKRPIITLSDVKAIIAKTTALFKKGGSSQATQPASQSAKVTQAKGTEGQTSAITDKIEGNKPTVAGGDKQVLANKEDLRQKQQKGMGNATKDLSNSQNGDVLGNNKVESLSNSKSLPLVGKTSGYENQNIKISTGAENIALYPKLKLDLQTEQSAALVIDSLKKTGRLPDEYVTKDIARELHSWSGSKPFKQGQIGGDVFRNESHLLPSKTGRIWYEADIGINNNIGRNKQPGTRLLYSNDGLLFITTDHYKTVKEVGRWK